MPRGLKIKDSAPASVVRGAQNLGVRIQIARKRRRIPQRELAERAGIAYETERAAEAGSLSTGIGAYLALIWALGLEREVESLLDPDRDIEGKTLELVRLPLRVRKRKRDVLDSDF